VRAPSEIYLIRHGHSTANLKNVLAGRLASVHLSPKGSEQVGKLAARLSEIEFTKIISSPLDRCLETMAPIASSRPKLLIERNEAFLEMDYGTWSGKKLPLLAKKTLWKSIQGAPSTVRFPDGESFNEVSTRAYEGLFASALPGKRIAICSHGDVIKILLSNILGMHIDSFQRINVDPASISIIQIGASGNRVLLMNDTSHLDARKSSNSHSVLGGGSG
jgi:probable phosphoglycerate mutase